MRGCWPALLIATRRWLPSCLILVLASAAWTLPPVMARAENPRRLALVIGNGAYAHTQALADPTADAQAVAAALRATGMDVTLALDLDHTAMVHTLRDFADRVDGADLALLYYAGHGLQVASGSSSENYLVPIDAKLQDARDVEDEAVGLDRALGWLAGARARVVILDACRDNPLVSGMRGVSSTRSINRGLARVDTPTKGTLLVYSTEPGAVAADDDGAGHSPFTAALLRHITSPGLELRSMFTKVRADVYHATDERQTPWSNDGLLDDIFLVPPRDAGQPAPDAPPAVSPDLVEVARWNAIKNTGKSDDLRAYLNDYPNGLFVELARERIEKLRRDEAGAPATGAVSPRGKEPAPPAATASLAPVNPPQPAKPARRPPAASDAGGSPRAQAIQAPDPRPARPREQTAQANCGPLLPLLSFDTAGRPPDVPAARWHACGGR